MLRRKRHELVLHKCRLVPYLALPGIQEMKNLMEKLDSNLKLLNVLHLFNPGKLLFGGMSCSFL